MCWVLVSPVRETNCNIDSPSLEFSSLLTGVRKQKTRARVDMGSIKGTEGSLQP